MAICFSTEIKVFGNKDDLGRFKLDMAGDEDNGPLSFANIDPEIKKVRDWKTHDVYYPELVDKDDYLFYSFFTRRYLPYRIYEIVTAKYCNLDFDIKILCDCDFSWNEMASKKGKTIKDVYFYWDCISWQDGKYKDILYKKNYLNNSLQVMEERIFRPGEYDEGLHMWVRKTI